MTGVGGRLATGLTGAFVVAVLAVGAVKVKPAAAQTTVVCPAPVVRLVRDLTNLSGRLDIGLTYSQYQAAASAASVDYDRISWHHVGYQCVAQVGIWAERAVNNYLKAYSAWHSCMESAATTCVKPYSPGYGTEQKYWDAAKVDVGKVVENLG